MSRACRRPDAPRVAAERGAQARYARVVAVAAGAVGLSTTTWRRGFSTWWSQGR